MMQFNPDLSNNETILGIGCDLCDMTRVEKLYIQFQDKFLNRIFSEAECTNFANVAEVKKVPFLAKRFATKEAVAKALQTGIGKHAVFTEISCVNLPSGAPYVILSGAAHHTALKQAQAKKFENYKTYISLSDDNGFALSFVVLAGSYEAL